MPGAGEGRCRGTTAPSAVNGPVYSVAAVRAAEEPLLRGAGGPPEDGLMRRAARAVAEAALAVLPTPAAGVLVLAGPGGNGGDALYAAATLADAGHPVTAVAVGRDGATHPRATAAARAAGVRVAAAADILPAADDTARPPRFSLVIDGIAGIGHARPLDDAAALAALGPVLAVDVPSGVDADTGHAPGAHVTAAVTVTFGVRRVAHVTSDACGRVLVADIGLAPGLAAVADEHRPVATALSGWEPRPTWPGPAGGPGSGPGGRPSALVVDPAVVPPERRAPVVDIRPGATSDKYSGGVVGVLAGSAAYPGAGVLATTGAVRATPSMVRYVGSGRDEIVRALPEVVAVSALDDCGRVQAWVVGSGPGHRPGGAGGAGRPARPAGTAGRRRRRPHAPRRRRGPALRAHRPGRADGPHPARRRVRPPRAGPARRRGPARRGPRARPPAGVRRAAQGEVHRRHRRHGHDGRRQRHVVVRDPGLRGRALRDPRGARRRGGRGRRHLRRLGRHRRRQRRRLGRHRRRQRRRLGRHRRHRPADCRGPRPGRRRRPGPRGRRGALGHPPGGGGADERLPHRRLRPPGVGVAPRGPRRPRLTPA
ncbi:hypothetical protein CXF44_03635 [Corynebacterium bovis]|nr:hypothetical protein CXF44_03635 [Corynebacterium bovis]